MHRYRRWNLSIILIISMVLIAGCVERKQLENLGLITAAGYDMEQQNKIKGTIVIHKFDPIAQNMTKVISDIAHTSRGLRQKQNLESNQKLVTGQLRIVVYSKELAKKGIIQLVDTLNRDANVGNMVYLTVADGSASSIMKIDLKTPTSINLGTYLYNLIKQNVDGEQIVSPTLQEFNRNYNDTGKDPVLPILKIKKNDVIISGLALFKDDRMIGKVKPEKLFFLKILIDKYKAGTQELDFSRDRLKKIILQNAFQKERHVYNKVYISFDNIQSKSRIKLVDKKNLLFRVNVKLYSRLLEATEPLDLGNPVAVKTIEKEINKSVKENIEDLLHQFQKLDIDPVGFGNVYEAHYRGKLPTSSEWKQKYKLAKFEVVVDNKIVQTGVMD
ncbi:Ger(x)C family spore germination protein [Neobacillus ginsengisoli]|uniref:Spore germination protein n=1 Tax=Neobacillus ginsengisoli TaxID=904295 RepID=A0ABT9XQJ8_9BACI|nr:Ger(x)C family spore germination protein [Neobacillus ginsengisoli]MDQ0197626.1 spore germination protein [Neobacillus ginsengisoli]